MKDTAKVRHYEATRLRKVIALLRESHRVTKAELAYANECSEKTIQRGIAILKADGWPIEYDRDGYFLAPQYESDLRSSHNQQVASLVIAGCAIDRHLAESLPEVVDAIRGKLLKLPDVTTLSYRFSSASIDFERCSFTSDQLEAFGCLARNIIDGIAVTFNYRSFDKQNMTIRKVYPMRLCQRENVWYLYGYDIERKALRIFTVKKIALVVTLKEPFHPPGLEVEEQVNQMGEFSIWDSGAGCKQVVRIKLSEYAADYVRTHQIHSSQSVKELDENTVILQLKTSDLTGVKLWLRKFLHLGEILKPEKLRLEYIADLETALSINRAK